MSSSSVARLPSNAVVVADIGLHSTKSGLVNGTPALGFDENNITSSTSISGGGGGSKKAGGGAFGNNYSRSSGGGQSGTGNVKQAAQMMLDSALGNNSSNNNDGSSVDGNVILKRTYGLDIDYRVLNPDLVVKNSLSCLPGFAAFFGDDDDDDDESLGQDAAAQQRGNDDDNTTNSNIDLESGFNNDEDRASFYSRRRKNFINNNKKNNGAAASSSSRFEIPGCVALFLPFGMRRLCIEKVLEAMFEGPAPPRVFLGCSSLQALTSIGLTSGTVVDVGQFETRILPATEGSCHRAFALRNQRLGGAYQSLAAVSSLLQKCHHNNTSNNNSQDSSSTAATLNALSENILSRPYMKSFQQQITNNSSNKNNFFAFSPQQSILASTADLCDDVVKIFALSALNNQNDNNNNESEKSSLQQDSSTKMMLPDGHQVLPKNNNNNLPSSSFLPLDSVVNLQDDYCDYLFKPTSYHEALHRYGKSTPLLDCLSQTLFSSSSSSFNNNPQVPTMNLTDSLKFVLRRIAAENTGNHNSTMFRSACSNIVLTGGGSMLPSVESAFARTVESTKFTQSCILGGPVNQNSNNTNQENHQYSFFSQESNNNITTNTKKSKSSASTTTSSSSASRPNYRALRDRMNSNWIGGSLLMQTGSVVDVTITASTFFEEGPHACASVYGVGGWKS